MDKTENLWVNWSETQACSPQQMVFPSTEKELIDCVRSAIKSNMKVKVVGSGDTEIEPNHPRSIVPWLCELSFQNIAQQETNGYAHKTDN